MDRRKIYIEQENTNTIFDTLSSEDINLELAQNIENLFELREIIKFKANQSFMEKSEKSKSFTIFSSTATLEDRPRSWYLITFVLWFMAYRRKSKGLEFIHHNYILYLIFSKFSINSSISFFIYKIFFYLVVGRISFLWMIFGLNFAENMSNNDVYI
jgi:hypothetical protein